MILQKTLTFFWLLVLLFKALKIAFFLFVFSKPTALLPKKSHVSGNGMPPKKLSKHQLFEFRNHKYCYWFKFFLCDIFIFSILFLNLFKSYVKYNVSIWSLEHIHLWHILVAIKTRTKPILCPGGQSVLFCREKSGLCPHLCAKLYCYILLSSMFKIYEANIIYFHFCIVPFSPFSFLYGPLTKNTRKEITWKQNEVIK